MVFNPVQDAEAEVSELLERALGQVNVSRLATGAQVDHGHVDGPALV